MSARSELLRAAAAYAIATHRTEAVVPDPDHWTTYTPHACGDSASMWGDSAGKWVKLDEAQAVYERQEATIAVLAAALRGLVDGRDSGQTTRDDWTAARQALRLFDGPPAEG